MAGQTLVPPTELIDRQSTNGERNNMTSESKCHEHRTKQSKEGGRDGLGQRAAGKPRGPWGGGEPREELKKVRPEEGLARAGVPRGALCVEQQEDQWEENQGEESSEKAGGRRGRGLGLRPPGV